MSQVVGGLRARFIRDSIYYMLYDRLADLGWFDEGRHHDPISFTGDEVDREEEIKFNTIALVDEDLSEAEDELGSNLAEHRWQFYVDFYAESADIGKQLINDVRDILGGRMSTIGRDDPSVDIYDLRDATPSIIFRVQIEEISVDRAHDWPKPWLKHWHACAFTIVDHYGDEANS